MSAILHSTEGEREAFDVWFWLEPECKGDCWEAWQARAALSGWQPIETAPKDQDVLLYCKARGVVRGRWEDCYFARKPRPYWTNDREALFGVSGTRNDQPTHWMPLPPAPNQGEAS